ncbi:unnamed protein product, partial [Polarella glacialis]
AIPFGSMDANFESDDESLPMSLLLKPAPAPRDAFVSLEDVLHALEAQAFPESQRKNVRQANAETAPQGMCLGITGNWIKGAAVSVQTRKKPQLSALLCAFARQELPGFRFSSVQVNKDYRAALHVDKNNHGLSYIIGLGDYSGGWLWVDNGSSTGRAKDIRNRWFQFDGNRPHCVDDILWSSSPTAILA